MLPTPARSIGAPLRVVPDKFSDALGFGRTNWIFLHASTCMLLTCVKVPWTEFHDILQNESPSIINRQKSSFKSVSPSLPPSHMHFGRFCFCGGAPFDSISPRKKQLHSIAVSRLCFSRMHFVGHDIMPFPQFLAQCSGLNRWEHRVLTLKLWISAGVFLGQILCIHPAFLVHLFFRPSVTVLFVLRENRMSRGPRLISLVGKVKHVHRDEDGGGGGGGVVRNRERERKRERASIFV